MKNLILFLIIPIILFSQNIELYDTAVNDTLPSYYLGLFNDYNTKKIPADLYQIDYTEKHDLYNGRYWDYFNHIENVHNIKNYMVGNNDEDFYSDSWTESNTTVISWLDTTSLYPDYNDLYIRSIRWDNTTSTRFVYENIEVPAGITNFKLGMWVNKDSLQSWYNNITTDYIYIGFYLNSNWYYYTFNLANTDDYLGDNYNSFIYDYTTTAGDLSVKKRTYCLEHRGSWLYMVFEGEVLSGTISTMMIYFEARNAAVNLYNYPLMILNPTLLYNQDWISPSIVYQDSTKSTKVFRNTHVIDSLSKTIAYSSLNIWEGDKQYNNPVVAGTVGGATQFYPPTPVKTDSFYVLAKSNSKVYGTASSDGITFTDPVLVLDNTSTGSWNTGKLEYTLLRYNPDNTTYYLYFSGVGTYTNAMSYATSSSATSGYTVWEADSIWYSPDDFNTDFGITGFTCTGLYFSDMIKYNNEYIFYGVANSSTSDRNYMFCVTSPSMTAKPTGRNIIMEDRNVNIKGTVLQSPSVVKQGLQFVMSFTAGTSDVEYRQRELFIAYGGPYYFTPASQPILKVGEPTSWEDLRVYAAQWLKEQDGVYQVGETSLDSLYLFYSGHSVDFTESIGQTGIAKFDSIGYLSNVTLSSQANNNLDKTIKYDSSLDAISILDSVQFSKGIRFDADNTLDTLYFNSDTLIIRINGITKKIQLFD